MWRQGWNGKLSLCNYQRKDWFMQEFQEDAKSGQRIEDFDEKQDICMA